MIILLILSIVSTFILMLLATILVMANVKDTPVWFTILMIGIIVIPIVTIWLEFALL